MNRILIVGVGELGSRHLQGLLSCEHLPEVHLFDLKQISLDRALNRLRENEMCGPSRLRVFCHISLETLPESFDIGISAVTADYRLSSLSQLGERCEVQTWILEKVLFQSFEDTLEAVKLLKSCDSVWMNCPRRLSSIYRRLREVLNAKPSGPLRVTISGSGWGLACNAIHFLDIISFLTGSPLVGVSTDGLSDRWTEAKRSGFLEVFGTLSATFGDGSTADLICETDRGVGLEVSFELESGVSFDVDEHEGRILSSNPMLSSLGVHGRLPYQSELTGGVVDSLLADRHPGLTNLEEASSLHEHYLGALLGHYQRNVSPESERVPIT